VAVDEAGHHRLVGEVDHGGPGRHVRADLPDAAVFDDDHDAFPDVLVRHVEQAPGADGDEGGGLGRGGESRHEEEERKDRSAHGAGSLPLGEPHSTPGRAQRGTK